ncbi:unnamed protein product [Lampetra fluviatilis]
MDGASSRRKALCELEEGSSWLSPPPKPVPPPITRSQKQQPDDGDDDGDDDDGDGGGSNGDDVEAELAGGKGSRTMAEASGDWSPLPGKRLPLPFPIPVSNLQINESGRFHASSGGTFHCNATDLIFEVGAAGRLHYGWREWPAELSQAQFVPISATFDIKWDGCDGGLRALMIPHYLDLKRWKHTSAIKVLHTRDGNIEVRDPQHVSQTHVRVLTTSLSIFTAVLRWFPGFVYHVHAAVLIFKVPGLLTKLQVHVVPYADANILRLKRILQQERYEYYNIPPKSDETLVVSKRYALTCNVATNSIQPQKLTMENPASDNNFIHVSFDGAFEAVFLTLIKRGRQEKNVWTRMVQWRDKERAPQAPEAAKSRSVSPQSQEQLFDKIRSEIPALVGALQGDLTPLLNEFDAKKTLTPPEILRHRRRVCGRQALESCGRYNEILLKRNVGSRSALGEKRDVNSEQRDHRGSAVWNIRTLAAEERLPLLGLEVDGYRMDLCAVREVRRCREQDLQEVDMYFEHSSQCPSSSPFPPPVKRSQRQLPRDLSECRRSGRPFLPPTGCFVSFPPPDRVLPTADALPGVLHLAVAERSRRLPPDDVEDEDGDDCDHGDDDHSDHGDDDDDDEAEAARRGSFWFTAEVDGARRTVFGSSSVRFDASSGGTFHCKATDLIFEVGAAGRLRYGWREWPAELFQVQFVPISTTFDINWDGCDGGLHALMIPHYLDLKRWKHTSAIKVLHTRDGNIEVRDPQRVSQTHVRVLTTSLSIFTAVLRWIPGFVYHVHAAVLVFKVPGSLTKLQVHVVPYADANIERLKRKLRQERYEYYNIPPKSDETLGVAKRYALSCNVATNSIQPQNLMMENPASDNNFIHVSFYGAFEEVFLTLTKKGQQEKDVWTRTVQWRDKETAPQAPEAAKSRSVRPQSPEQLFDKIRSEIPALVGALQGNLTPLLIEFAAKKTLTQSEIAQIRAVSFCNGGFEAASQLVTLILEKHAGISVPVWEALWQTRNTYRKLRGLLSDVFPDRDP